jgi:hypothetical protein
MTWVPFFLHPKPVKLICAMPCRYFQNDARTVRFLHNPGALKIAGGVVFLMPTRPGVKYCSLQKQG